MIRVVIRCWLSDSPSNRVPVPGAATLSCAWSGCPKFGLGLGIGLGLLHNEDAELISHMINGIRTPHRLKTDYRTTDQG